MRSFCFSLLLLAPALAFAGGADDYKTYCAMCHGDTGKGDGAASAGLEPKPANFGTADFWKGKDDAYLARVIKEGGAAVGKSPMMAPWGAVLDDAKIQAVVAHIKTFQPKAEAAK